MMRCSFGVNGEHATAHEASVNAECAVSPVSGTTHQSYCAAEQRAACHVSIGAAVAKNLKKTSKLTGIINAMAVGSTLTDPRVSGEGRSLR